MSKPTLPGIRAELAAAVRRVNATYARVPESNWPEVNGEDWRRLEEEVDAACAAGDRGRAIAAIDRWEQHALAELGRSSR